MWLFQCGVSQTEDKAPDAVVAVAGIVAAVVWGMVATHVSVYAAFDLIQRLVSEVSSGHILAALFVRPHARCHLP